jgi:hypothetical protein
MTTPSFTAFLSTNDNNNSIYDVLNNPSVVASVSSTVATFTVGSGTGALELVLHGTGFSGTLPTSSWNISQIDGFRDFGSGLQQVFDATVSVKGDVFLTAVNALNPGAVLFAGGAVISSGGDQHSVSYLLGDGGTDFIFASPHGNDKLGGDAGTGSQIHCGLGHDAILFNDEVLSGTHIPEVFAFHPNKDTIQVALIQFENIGQYGQLTLGEFASGTHLKALSKSGADIIYETKNGELFYDSNGHHAGGLHEIAQFVGHPHMSADNFFVV